jgi:hypothetical protein
LCACPGEPLVSPLRGVCRLGFRRKPALSPVARGGTCGPAGSDLCFLFSDF